ncbi:MAG: selenate reductase [Oscillospiraceae bacterium]|nr:selenate reductase [Oscillospiraceae bacterium]
MSDKMYPLPFESLMKWLLSEHEAGGTALGLRKSFKKCGGSCCEVFGEKLELPLGPAAGPNTQMAQNIIAAYLSGARFFELKTVQIMDGDELAACVPKPCINSADEGYNCEWSTELTTAQAQQEYIKAWFALKYVSHKWGLGDPDAFVFNMSVGYDLKGIQSKKIDDFMEGLRDASGLDTFKEGRNILTRLCPEDAEYIESISPRISRSVTLSTLHGCPPDEIERIAGYLLEEKKLNTFIKCNPTLLGYDRVREILDKHGYDYMVFDTHHFEEDMQYADAIPMFERLMATAERLGLQFGLKLSNTLPVDVKAGELPSQEMYMSGRALFPVTSALAAKIATDTGGRLWLSYSGGADLRSVNELVSCGVWPVTLCTALLGPGGYGKLIPIAEKLSELSIPDFTGIDVAGINRIADEALTSDYYDRGKKRKAGPGCQGALYCRKVCGGCVAVCPNRANLLLTDRDGVSRMVHLDRLCNECGNCAYVCPEGCKPYKDRFTVFKNGTCSPGEGTDRLLEDFKRDFAFMIEG